MAGSDATEYSMSGFCLHMIGPKTRSKPLQLIQPWQARFVCRDSDHFWVYLGVLKIMQWERKKGWEARERRVREDEMMNSGIFFPIWKRSGLRGHFHSCLNIADKRGERIFQDILFFNCFSCSKLCFEHFQLFLFPVRRFFQALVWMFSRRLGFEPETLKKHPGELLVLFNWKVLL